MLYDFINWILVTVETWGYWGIFFAMTLESTVFPVPSELVVIPAGMLAYQGKLNLSLVILASTAGSLLGATLNYVFAMWVGRPFLEKYGKYFFVRPALLHKTDIFFTKHGAISTFTGRLIPGIRHLISLPAGLVRMNFASFAFYTTVGAGLWSIVLALFGYFIGGSQSVIEENKTLIVLATLGFVALVLVGYYLWQKRQST
ncbi:DedA family protein [Thiothrix fructosivorans]|uniref:DedA family protein n=1 Tax=Thiothrix fructosivorans TaxID=111770 RepID=A0A8B0SF80_9GAMM|nr:DedA family protein [Thiothrix fructosivorans]MBO0614228.1 DedA family protein [Thiothrix fructosivorans]QTX09080.1 DedA family protein [Thiothrix fructosivorans]